MPGAVLSSPHTSEGDAEDGDIEMAENISLLLPSSLDPERRKRVCLQEVAEHERLLRMAHLQDSLAELQHTRRIRRKLLINHHIQVAGQGQHANTRSRTVLNNVESRITKFVERYRIAYQALLQLDPTGDWREMYLELKDCDNRGPGKESYEEGLGDGSYLRSWIWLPNPRAPTAADDDTGEEGASEEDINELLRVEWTTSFARLERWNEEVELLQEEMRRVVTFLEWKSQDWLAKVETPRGNVTPDIQCGLNAYAKKQAAVHRNLALSFAKLWRPTLVSYGLEHSSLTEYLTKNGVLLDGTNTPALSTRGIFKFRLSRKPDTAVSAAAAVSSTEEVTVNDSPILGEYNPSEDSSVEDSSLEDGGLEDGGLEDGGLEDGDMHFEDDWGDDLDF